MKLRLYNTLSKKVEDFVPARDGLARLYTCGPTVYNYLHIGNYRTYVFEDVLKRTMRYFGTPIRHVMNITDVGHLVSDGDEGADKMQKAAEREGKTAWDLAKFYTQTFLDDAKKLNLLFAPVVDAAREDNKEAIDILCRATDHIEEQKRMVDKLVEKGVTYETADGIYFDTAKFPQYGVLAGADHIKGLQSGSRVAMGDKKNLTDFALWKFSPKDEQRQMEWDYRGRKGFPGWHIECSAMGQTYLGETFDIHCGGVDHIPIHHANEIAQAEAATGKEPFVRFWVHGEFLVMNKSKMAKSAGGFIRLQDLADKGIDALDYRYFCYGAHYRKQLDFSWEALEAAKTARRRLREKVVEWNKQPAFLDELLVGDVDPATGNLINGKEFKIGIGSDESNSWIESFENEIANDMNIPGALGAVHEGLSDLSQTEDKIALLWNAERVLALGLFGPEEMQELPQQLQNMFEGYQRARKAKNYAESDKLRNELKEAGIQVLDSKEGSSWKKI
jgi:cysteinyl-tRNA synthetase